MLVSEALGINEQGHLTIGGVDAVEIAKEYGTPVYVMDEALIRKNCRLYLNSIRKACGGKGLALYASKAFSCAYVLKVAKEEGMGLDVVSGGELYTAIKADFPAEKIYFHGNNKTPEELKMAVDYGVGRYVVDNKYELELLNKIAQEAGKKVSILFRIKPGIDAHTHDFIRTGQIDSKFGFALETGEAMAAVKHAMEYPHLNLVGMHCHIGSQIFDFDPFELAAEVMVGFLGDIKEETGLELEELNLGGGYGIRYLPSDDPIGYGDYIGKIAETVERCAAQRGIKMPMILMEPGRSLVGSAGITLYTVGAVKDIPGVRRYVSVDGGMCDNPRYILYRSQYAAVLANKANAKPVSEVTIAGKCCESGDLLGEHMMMPQIQPGDILAMEATGAYNYSMASNYNRIPRPPVVMVKEGKTKVIVKRETYEDLVKNDVLD